jgi:hypothetical protein
VNGKEPNQVIFCDIKRLSSAVVVRGLENIGEFELFRNDGINVMNFGNEIQALAMKSKVGLLVRRSAGDKGSVYKGLEIVII